MLKSTTFSSPFPQNSFLFLLPSGILYPLLQDPESNCCRRSNCSSSPWTKWLLSQIGSKASKYRDLAIFILFFSRFWRLKTFKNTSLSNFWCFNFCFWRNFASKKRRAVSSSSSSSSSSRLHIWRSCRNIRNVIWRA